MTPSPGSVTLRKESANDSTPPLLPQPPKRIKGSPLHLTWVAFFVIAFFLPHDDCTVLSEDIPASSIRQRGKHIGSTVTSDDLYRAYQEIQQDYHQKAFSDSHKWKLLHHNDGVEIRILHHPTDPTCPYVQMKAIMPTSVQDCWNFLRLEHWDQTMPHMDPFYEGVSLLGHYRHKGTEMILARKRTKRILAFGKRDFVFVSVSDVPRKDGTWVSGTVSVITERQPRAPNYTRAFQDSIAFYKPLSLDKTELTIVCRIDLNDSADDGQGGAMPMWLYVKTIGTTGARSVLSMRKYLEREVQQRKEKQEAERIAEKGKAVFPWFGMEKESIFNLQKYIEREFQQKVKAPVNDNNFWKRATFSSWFAKEKDSIEVSKRGDQMIARGAEWKSTRKGKAM